MISNYHSSFNCLIQAKRTRYDKVDTLIDILGRRPDAVFEVFCELVENENSDLSHLLNGLEGKTVVAC